MIDTEELLRLTLHRHVEAAPEITGLRTDPMPRVSKKRWVVPLAVACATAVLTLVVAWLNEFPVVSDSAVPASSYEDVADLTGVDVGLALGLEPSPFPIRGCDLAVGYELAQAFCLDGVTGDPLEERVLALQISGYQRNSALIEYAQLNLELGAFGDNNISTQDAKAFRAIVDRMRFLRESELVLGDEQRPVQPLPQDLALADVEGLTGVEVIELLRLQPLTAPDTGCNHSVGRSGVSYCLDGLDHDPWLSTHVGEQIKGYEDNAALHAFVDAYVEFREQDRASTDSETKWTWSEVTDLLQEMTRSSEAD